MNPFKEIFFHGIDVSPSIRLKRLSNTFPLEFVSFHRGTKYLRRVGLFVLGILLTGMAYADGFKVASRYVSQIASSSEVVLGNGRLACHFYAASNSSAFLEGDLIGEHWLYGETTETTRESAKRVPLAHLRIDLGSGEETQVSPWRMAKDAKYSLQDGVLTNRFRTHKGIAGSTFCVSAATDVLIFSLNSPVTMHATVSISVDHAAGFSISQGTRENKDKDQTVLGLVHNLPHDEAYGLGILFGNGMKSTVVQTNTRGWLVRFRDKHSLSMRILLVEPEEQGSLLTSTLDKASLLSASSEEDMIRVSRKWWRSFWNRSSLDCSGSTDPRAAFLERVWVYANHALAVHARGTFPPNDSGFWNLHSQGRIWHPLIWPLYRGWIFFGHAGDIACLSYPAWLSSIEEPASTTEVLEPLLPVESGPDWVPADWKKESVLPDIWKENFGPIPDLDSELEALLFSSIPITAYYSSIFRNRTGEIQALYPFLKADADRALQILANRDRNLHQALVLHLRAAVLIAYFTAASSNLDLPARKVWGNALEGYALQDTPPLKFLSDEILGQNLFPRGVVGRTIDSLVQQTFSPEGTIRTRSGLPSLVKTGTILDGIRNLLVKDRRGVIRLFPGISRDGSWSIEAEGICLESGYSFPKIVMKNGIVDSVLMKSWKDGTCVLQLPQGWRTAQAVRMGDIQEMVAVAGPKSGPDDTRTVSFSVQAGKEYLIGPVW